jgi:hypothetical protein
MRFESELEFEAYYEALTSPEEQLRELAEWRGFQIKIVSKFIDQIRLIADEQYSDLDHFLLELLQNADDNDYPQCVTPKVSIVLSADELTLDNNESGFNAANLYAITYAAASTKIRRKSAATYIGEKGIGFKSVFAVADHVEIHSGPYHFRLNNGEFIVPHPAPIEEVTGTRIKLRFKQSRGDLAGILSERLERMGNGPREFTMFLRKLRVLQIEDRLAGRTHLIESGPDTKAGFWRVECDGVPRLYYRSEYARVIPGDVVETRFRDLKEDLPRQIDLAVPLPGVDGFGGADEGRLFCFLPTHVTTACPVRIQADAKTTTNRENIQNFGASPWNKCLFDGFAENLIDFYRRLTQLEEFKRDLPACWPIGASQRDVGNDDLKELLARVEKELGSHPLVLDRYGEYRCASEVRLLPKRFASWLADDACEAAVSSLAAERITFVDATWERRHRLPLGAIGVRELTTDELMAALACNFVARTVSDEELQQRSFLEDIMSLAEALPLQATKFKQFPIFPVRIGDRRTWAALSGDVFWIQSDSAKVAVPGDTPIVDATFTYSPGGSASRTPEGEKVRQFNARFRNFLAQTLGVPHHDELQLLRRTVVKDLRTASGELTDLAVRRKVNQAWSRLFTRAWKRQRTIINDLGQKAFDEFIAELKKCRVPARGVAKAPWVLVEVSSGFLGKPFNGEGVLDKAYFGTGAPFIQLDLLEEKKPKAKKAKRKAAGVDWPEWRRFFEAIGAHAGPYFVYVDLGSKECLGSYQDVGSAHGALGNLKVAVDAAVKAHGEFSSEGASSYSIHSRSRTVALDAYSLQALRRDQGHELIGRRIAAVWQEVEAFTTEIRFMWGMKYTARHTRTEAIALFDQLRALLKLETTRGLQSPSMCFVASGVNQRVLENVAPLVREGPGGYAPGMLRAMGVRGEVGIDDLKRLIEQWAADKQPEASGGADFAPMLETVCRYLEQHPSEAAQVEYRLKFFNPGSREMQGVSDWLSGAAPRLFDTSLAGRIRDLFGRGLARDAGTLAALLFEIGDVLAEGESLFRALADLGRRLSVEGSAGALRVFESKLTETGLVVDGTIIRQRQDLPVVWDISPLPTDDGPWLVAHLPTDQRQFVSSALQALGWPCVSSASSEPVNLEALTTLDGATASLVALSVEDVTRRVSANRPDIGARLRSIGLLGSSEAVMAGVRIATGLSLAVKLGPASLTAQVPYWHSEACLYVDSACPLERALAEFIDRETNATCSGFFDLVWQQAKAKVRVESGDGGPPSPSPSPPPGGGKTGDRAVGQSGTETSGGTAGNGGGDASTGAGTEPKERDGPRKRLCSYVTFAGEGGEGKDGGSSAVNGDSKEIEEAGRAHMLEYFHRKEAQVVSREKDNVGWDFEVTVGSKTIFVELKASRDGWQGWEHALTRNEFIQAFAKGEDYFLCAVDRVLTDEWKVYFIANPAGQVDQYIFDDPWKRVAVDMNDLLDQMKNNTDSEEV